MAKKLMTWGAMVIVAIIVIGGIFWLSNNNYSFTPENNENPSITVEEEDGQEKTPEGSTPVTNYPVVSSTLSYSDAVRIYSDKRIQFNETCVPVPTSPTFKKGVTIMLDNRGSKARTISLDGKAISLAAYGFKLVTLSTSAPLPHTVMVDCGNGENNATILLQQ